VTGPEPAVLSDLELVRQAQAGDSDAFGELVERNRRAVFRAALAAVGNAAEADDVAQDTFVMAYRKLAGFRGEATFRTWLLSIAWRKALDRRKGLMRWVRMGSGGGFDDEGVDTMEHIASTAQPHDETLAAADLQRRVRRLIATLPRKFRDALLLAGSGDHTYEQIGAMLEVPVGTVKWRVSEARRLLKMKIEHGSGFKIQSSSVRGSVVHGARFKVHSPRSEAEDSESKVRR
jgi:RNA polymerase sigma-70 factor (ECF subfamily)